MKHADSTPPLLRALAEVLAERGSRSVPSPVVKALHYHHCDCGCSLYLQPEQWPGTVDGSAELEDYPGCPSCSALLTRPPILWTPRAT